MTKTKPSHHHPTNKAATPVKIDAPTTAGGVTLAEEVKSSGVPDTVKARLIRDIIEYEGSHGKCTQTFTKKVRKQLRAGGG